MDQKQSNGWLAMIGVEKLKLLTYDDVNVEELMEQEHSGAIAEQVQKALESHCMIHENGQPTDRIKLKITSLSFSIEFASHYHCHLNVTFKARQTGAYFKNFLKKCNAHLNGVHIEPIKFTIAANLYIAKGLTADSYKELCSEQAKEIEDSVMPHSIYMDPAHFTLAWNTIKDKTIDDENPYGNDLFGFALIGCNGDKQTKVEWIDFQTAIEEERFQFPVIKPGGTSGAHGGAREGAGRPNKMDAIMEAVWDFIEDQAVSCDEPNWKALQGQAVDLMGRKFKKWGFAADSAVKSMISSAQRKHAELVESGELELPITNGLFNLNFNITDATGKLVVQDALDKAFHPQRPTKLRCLIEVVGESGSGKTYWVQDMIEGELGVGAMVNKSLVNGNAFKNVDFPGTDFRPTQKVIIFSELEAHNVTRLFKEFCSLIDINGASLNQKNAAEGVQSKAFLHFWVNIMPLTVTFALWVQKNGKISLQNPQQLLRRVTATLYLKKDCNCAAQGILTCTCAPSKFWLSPLNINPDGSLKAPQDWLDVVKPHELSNWGFDETGLFKPPAMADGFNIGVQ